MSEKHESVLEWWQRSRRFLSEAAGYPRAACAVVPYIADASSNLPICCEFAQGKFSERSEGRLCKVDGCYCSPAIFKVPVLFKDCDLRLAELAKKET